MDTKLFLSCAAAALIAAGQAIRTELDSGGNAAPSAGEGKGSSGSAASASGGSAAKKAAGQPKPDEAPKDGSATGSTSEPDVSGGIAYETVSAKVLEVSKQKGRDAAVELLGKFKSEKGEAATKGAMLQPKDYPAFMEAAQAVLDDLS